MISLSGSTHLMELQNLFKVSNIFFNFGSMFLGRLDSVTTLIGVSIKGEAKMGIIGKYFTHKEGKEYNWIPKCYFAHADSPHLYYVDYSDPTHVKEFFRPENKERFFSFVGPTFDPINNRLYICTSKSRSAVDKFQKHFDVMKPDKIFRVGKKKSFFFRFSQIFLRRSRK